VLRARRPPSARRRRRRPGATFVPLRARAAIEDFPLSLGTYVPESRRSPKSGSPASLLPEDKLRLRRRLGIKKITFIPQRE